MDALEQARAEIDTVDAQLAALFERRMAAVLQVAEYKRAHGLPIYDAAREAAVLEKSAARIQDAALRPYYRNIQLCGQMHLLPYLPGITHHSHIRCNHSRNTCGFCRIHNGSFSGSCASMKISCVRYQQFSRPCAISSPASVKDWLPCRIVS